MHEKHSLLLVVVRLSKSLRDVFQLNDLGSVPACGVEIIPGRAAMSEHHRATSKHPAGVCHSLRVIPTAHRYHTRAPRVLEFGENLVKGSAYFECAGSLKQFQFEINVDTQHFAYSAAVSRGSAFDVLRDALARLLNVEKGDHLPLKIEENTGCSK